MSFSFASVEKPDFAASILGRNFNLATPIRLRIVNQWAAKSEEKSHNIDREPINGEKWIDNVACGFGHFGFVHCPVAMDEDVSRKRQVEGHEECRPVYAVEATLISILYWLRREITYRTISFPTM
ncbi:hypothetical protein TMatcc_001689 [Talaromyces marneffei ATCC 18224]